MRFSYKSSLPNVARHLARFGLYFIASAVVVVVGTLLAWRLTRFFSPVDSSSGGGTTVTLKSSDHKISGSTKIPLSDSLTATDTPYYNDTINSGPMPVTQSGNSFTMFRIQGEVRYR